MNNDETKEIEEVFELCHNSVKSGKPPFEIIGMIEGKIAHLLGYELIVEPNKPLEWRK